MNKQEKLTAFVNKEFKKLMIEVENFVGSVGFQESQRDLTEQLNQIKEYDKYFKESQKLIKTLLDRYIPNYERRTEKEHGEIRKRIKVDPSECEHLKGGSFRRPSTHKDFNVSYHIFAGGVERIRCLSCGQKWFSDDPCWNEALVMVKHSTNSRSCGEYVKTLVSQ